jgi:serine/threonine protein phosphatase PrpC
VRGSALTVRAYGATHTGRVRAGNEDSFLVGVAVHAVADGMGGHQAGEIASDAALEPLRTLDVSSLHDPQGVSEALATAVRDANTLVVERASSDPQLEGMGTTLTAVAVRDGQLHVAHVGDSRAYLLRDDEQMSQLTTDHTLVERLVREGRLSRDEAATHPQRNVITRAIGHETTVDVEVLPPITLHDGDQVLLCSDGLSGPVDDARIAGILAHTADGDKAVAALLAQANAAGGPDNITAVLLRVGDRWTDEEPPADESPDGSTTQQIASLPDRSDGAAAHGADGGAGTADAGATDDDTTTDAAPGRDVRAVAPPGEVSSREHDAAFDERDAPPPTRRTGMRIVAALTALVVVGALVVGGGWLLLSRSYFVGEHEGMVAIYRGIPQEFAGVSAARVVPTEISTTPVSAFPEFRQQAIADGLTAQSLTDAQLIVEDLQEQAREAQESAPTIGEPLTEPTQGP